MLTCMARVYCLHFSNIGRCVMWVTLKYVNLKCTYQHVRRVEPFSAHIIVLVHGGTHDGDVRSIDAPHALVHFVPLSETNGLPLETGKSSRYFVKEKTT